jgi:Flp pilus assembly protein TadD
VLLADPKNEMGLASAVLYDRALFFRYKLERDLRGAIADFKQLQKQFPESAAARRAYVQIGRAQCELGESDAARSTMNEMLAADPDDPALATSYGWFAFRGGCLEKEALEVVRKAIAIKPEDAELHYLAAELQGKLGDVAGARASIAKASTIEPDSAFFKRQIRRFEGMSP